MQAVQDLKKGFDLRKVAEIDGLRFRGPGYAYR